MCSCVKVVFRGKCLSTFSHDAVRILGLSLAIADGALYCEYRELDEFAEADIYTGHLRVAPMPCPYPLITYATEDLCCKCILAMLLTFGYVIAPYILCNFALSSKSF